MRRRVVLAVASGLSLCASVAWAQTGAAPFEQNTNMQTFRPAPGPFNVLTVHGARVEGNGTLSFGAWANYGWRPLTIFNATCPNSENDSGCTLGDVRSRPVEHLFTLDVMATVTLARRVQIGLTLPVSYSTGQAINLATAYPLAGDQSTSAFALGDPRVDVKVRLTRPGLTGVGAAVAAFGTIPTGRYTGGDRHYVADDTLALGARGIVDVREGRFFAAANLGVVWRPETLTFLSTRVGTQLLWGVGGGFAATPRVSFLAEFFGASNFEAVQQANGVEGDLAARYTLGDLAITAGGGVGIVRAAGTPVARGFVGVTWAPVRVDSDNDGVDDSVDRCVGEVEDHDGYDDLDGCLDSDNDGDGIPDDSDRCPDQPEDRDNFQDNDGCPDLDNDNDGVPDGYDSCPREAEDRDGDHDEDGCPDNDRDRDGVPDEQDRCQGDPEDMDGVEDNDGCPDPDNDHDGVPDVSDRCPTEPMGEGADARQQGCPDTDRDHDGVSDANDRCPAEAETINGVRDDDGCAETPARPGAAVPGALARVRITRANEGDAGTVTLLQPVRFGADDRVLPVSVPVIQQLAVALRATSRPVWRAWELSVPTTAATVRGPMAVDAARANRRRDQVIAALRALGVGELVLTGGAPAAPLAPRVIATGGDRGVVLTLHETAAPAGSNP